MKTTHIEATRYAFFSTLLLLYPLWRSGTHFTVQHWNTLCPWQQKCIHFVITIWLCGRQLRHVVLYGDCDHALRFIHIHWTVPSTERRNRALAYESCGAGTEVPLMLFCVQWVRWEERNFGGSYRCALVVILRTAVSFCWCLISGFLFWRRAASNPHIFLMLILRLASMILDH